MVSPKEQNRATWIDKAFQEQLSPDRDFPHNAPVRFQYVICCGHRTGSNLLSEALYQTGQAGDPIDCLDATFMNAYLKKQGMEQLVIGEYMEAWKARRTSSNGVFGFNIKFDHVHHHFKNIPQEGINLIKKNNYVLYLYRKNKVRQAVSLYIAGSRNLYNIPPDVTDQKVREFTDTVEFMPEMIAAQLQAILNVERGWFNFFKKNDINYEILAYEDFVADYEGTINHVLDRLGADVKGRAIPEMPLKKVANEKHEEFYTRFLDFINGEPDSSLKF